MGPVGFLAVGTFEPDFGELGSSRGKVLWAGRGKVWRLSGVCRCQRCSVKFWSSIDNWNLDYSKNN